MAYGVYFIPEAAVPQQIGLGTTAMLTLIAFMLTLGSSLPRISYLTRADRFFVGSAVLVFLGVMKAVATLTLAQGPKAGLIEQQIDRWGRWIFPFRSARELRARDSRTARFGAAVMATDVGHALHRNRRPLDMVAVDR